MLSITEQESFMHLIFDVIHNGIGMSSLEWSLRNMKGRYGDLKEILNTRMKNERYSNNYDLPIMKVIFETQNHILKVSEEEFCKRKIDAINLLQSYGASLDVLKEKYNGSEVYWEFYVQHGQLSQEIYEMVKNTNPKMIVI
jgi:hypothetical protein